MRSTEALPRFVCPDWWDKIQAGRTPMPAVPLNEARAAKALAFFNRLRLPDVAGNPRLAEACGDWFRDILCAFLASEDPVTKRRLVWELLCMVSKKNGRERETRRWLSGRAPGVTRVCWNAGNRSRHGCAISRPPAS